MLSEIKYWIADLFFSAELDDAYRLGVKAGTNQSLATQAFRVSTRRPDLTKTEFKGYLKAVEIMNESRNELLEKVGRIEGY